MSMSPWGSFEPLPHVRIGDAERDAAAAALGEHFAAGRLDRMELEERLAAACAARTQPELDRLFVDLPDPRRRRPGTPPRSRSHVPFPVPLVLLLFVLFLSIITRGAVLFPIAAVWLWAGASRHAAWGGRRR
jgi:hypothetical protein